MGSSKSNYKNTGRGSTGGSTSGGGTTTSETKKYYEKIMSAWVFGKRGHDESIVPNFKKKCF